MTKQRNICLEWIPEAYSNIPEVDSEKRLVADKFKLNPITGNKGKAAAGIYRAKRRKK